MLQSARRFTRIATIFTVFLLIGTLHSHKSAQPAPIETQSRFHVYSGGMHLLNTSLTTRVHKGELYEIEVQAAPNGFWGRLFPWHADMQATGIQNGNRYIPHQMTDITGWRDRRQKTLMTYNQEGRLIEMTRREDNGEVRPREINDTIAQSGTTDLLTAILSVLHPPSGELCVHNPKVFDGRRLYKIETSYEGQEDLAKNRYSSFAGTAHKCTVNIEPIEGFRDRKRGWMVVQEQGQEQQRLPTFWLTENGQGQYQIVRIELHTNYGAVIAHLQD